MKKLSKSITRLITVLVTIISLLAIAFFVFQIFGGQSKLTTWFQDWQQDNVALSYILFLALSPIINLIPGISSMFFISLGNMLFNDQTMWGMWRTFLVLAASVLLTSSLMFMIGKLGGKKVVEWIVGEKEAEKARYLLTVGGKAALPVMYLLPGFPDDSLALVCGMTDMSFLYNFVCTLIFRMAGVFTLTFLGSNFIDFKSFTIPQWAIFISVCIVVGVLLLTITFKYYQYLRRKNEGSKYDLIKGLRLKKAKKEDNNKTDTKVKQQ